jgi:hypothetical protein
MAFLWGFALRQLPLEGVFGLQDKGLVKNPRFTGEKCNWCQWLQRASQAFLVIKSAC